MRCFWFASASLTYSLFLLSGCTVADGPTDVPKGMPTNGAPTHSVPVASAASSTLSSAGPVESQASASPIASGAGSTAVSAAPLPSAAASAAESSGTVASAAPEDAGMLDATASALPSSSAEDAAVIPGNDCSGGKVVHFVYFVEADQAYSESQHADIERQALTFQEYWYEQLGVTFYLNQPIVEVIEADHDSQWYLETADGLHDDERWYRLGNVKKEVYGKLGIRDFDPDHRLVNYPTTRHDGRVGGNFGGAWMDGDDLTCIADDGPTYPYDDGGIAHCLGHPAHEFGHILGLDHEGPDTDCMQYGFYLSTVPGMCSFSAANVQKILDNPDNDGWFEALPGETCSGI